MEKQHGDQLGGRTHPQERAHKGYCTLETVKPSALRLWSFLSASDLQRVERATPQVSRLVAKKRLQRGVEEFHH